MLSRMEKCRERALVQKISHRPIRASATPEPGGRTGKDVSFQCRERASGSRSERRKAGTCGIRFANMPHSDFGNLRRSSQCLG